MAMFLNPPLMFRIFLHRNVVKILDLDAVEVQEDMLGLGSGEFG